MQNVTLIGIDLGKHSFHIHCQDKSGKVILRKKFTCPKLMEFLAGCSSVTVVMEACAGAHFMARRIADLGHEAKLISPQFVRPFVKSNKNDFRAFMMRLEHQHGRLAEWVQAQLSKKHSNVVACALANKLARIVWAITTRQNEYQA
ncbi:transposase [Xenorhabdus sp. Reich]|uniref:Transposase n=1 Tax=Xenorhabdus littoralis TaxID=2582835 RepID=A0ABU4SRP1_9GAMM|nr:hypothetical protein [Xenorhabdus sp. Reich]MDX8001239.1 transposase [Xenorhabdus sp. Reich]